MDRRGQEDRRRDDYDYRDDYRSRSRYGRDDKNRNRNRSRSRSTGRDRDRGRRSKSPRQRDYHEDNEKRYNDKYSTSFTGTNKSNYRVSDRIDEVKESSRNELNEPEAKEVLELE